jgi:hypothetical protein
VQKSVFFIEKKKKMQRSSACSCCTTRAERRRRDPRAVLHLRRDRAKLRRLRHMQECEVVRILRSFEWRNLPGLQVLNISFCFLKLKRKNHSFVF